MGVDKMNADFCDDFSSESYVVIKRKPFYEFLKRIFDITVSVIALVLLAVPMIIIVLLIKQNDKGQAIYSQRRIGKYGKYFNCYKFRSMVIDSENYEKYFNAEQLAQFKAELKVDNDPRITKIGDFIRKTSLDELPQLFSVLVGDMSLVGPRPIVDAEVHYYGKNLKLFQSVTPGITGYWQVNGRNNVTYESGERQKLELYYVQHRSLLLDAVIILKTFKAIFAKEGR